MKRSPNPRRGISNRRFSSAPRLVRGLRPRLEPLEDRQLLTVVTFGDATFDDALTADRAAVIQGAPVDAGATGADLAPDKTHSIGFMTGVSSTPGNAAGLGNDTTRNVVRVYWSDKHLKDQVGMDFVVSEIGSGGTPEAFAVSVKPVGGDFTNYVYQKPTATAPVGNATGAPVAFLTNFDLTADFRLPAGTEIEELRIENLIATDRVATATPPTPGEGAVYYDSNNFPTAGFLNTAGDVAYAASQFDADASYVFAVNSSNLVALPTTTYVNDNWSVVTDTAPAGLTDLDVVRNSNDVLDKGNVVGTYQHDAFGSVPLYSDNFDDNDNDGWQEYSAFTAFGLPSTFSYPPSSQGGLGYRIVSPASPNPAQLGPTRSAAVRPDILSDFRISVDLVDWNPGPDQAFGLISRAKEVGLGSTDGYLLAYDSRYGGTLYIAEATNEATSTINSVPIPLMTVGHDYRFVMSGVGLVLTGEMYDLTTGAQVAILSGIDTTGVPLATGQVGVFIAVDSSAGTGPSDATFDNFVAVQGGTRINDAIASTTKAGTVRVLDGVYRESVDLNRGVRLVGDAATIGDLIVSNSGTVSPSVGAPGVLNTGNLTFTSTGRFEVALGGANAGTGYNQLSVAGTVNLGGATLDVSRSFLPSLGHSFTIIRNDGNLDPVIGQFAGLAEGATVDVGGVPMVINYNGGPDGNDVTLTVPQVYVAGRHIFYNNSVFDGNNPAAGAADDQAIATDKHALFNFQPATSANYTSYTRGINGLMVDMRGIANATPNDFAFRVGNDDTTSDWTTPSVAPSVSIRQLPDNVSRVTLVWPDGSINNQWLQVTVNQSTGLATPDVFYFGNAVGESLNSTQDAAVNANDEIAARNNPKTFTNPASVTDAFDFDRDGFVNAADQIIARSNATAPNTELRLISPSNFFALSGGASSSGTEAAGSHLFILWVDADGSVGGLNTLESPVVTAAPVGRGAATTADPILAAASPPARIHTCGSAGTAESIDAVFGDLDDLEISTAL